MAISTYGELQTAVINWQEDRPDLAPFVPDFIALAEGYINAELRVRAMEKSTPLSPDASGVASLPSDLTEIIDVTTTASGASLSYMTRGTGGDLYAARAGVGAFYGVTGGSLRVYPVSQAGLTLVYYAALPPLAANPTNWLLAARPELYLRASLAQAAEFIKDDNEAAKQKSLADLAIQQMNMVDQRSRGRGGIQLRMVCP